jgi:molybdate transport system ATP-binding protein
MSADPIASTLSVRAQIANGFALDVAFDAPPGVTVLFGPSGSGKSTTLACIAGLARPTRGRIALGDEAWFDADRGVHVAVHRRRVAFVFQTLALFPHMTAAQNVAYGMDRSRQSGPGAHRLQALALLERLHVKHLADRKPPTFSGGEAQRVALARALATRPRVVLLDEPFSALDSDLRRGLIADLRDFVRELKLPVLFVNHLRYESHALGERLVLLEQGRIKHVGAMADLDRELER